MYLLQFFNTEIILGSGQISCRTVGNFAVAIPTFTAHLNICICLAVELAVIEHLRDDFSVAGNTVVLNSFRGISAGSEVITVGLKVIAIE